MRRRLRRWLGLATPIALLGGLLWLLAEGNVGLPALLRSATWGLVVWVGSSVIWLGLEYGQEHEDAHEQWGRIDPPGARRAHAGHASLG